jgi:N-acetylmuramoyl-L-alanine amidase
VGGKGAAVFLAAGAGSRLFDGRHALAFVNVMAFRARVAGRLVAAGAKNRRSVSAARCAGREGSEGTLEPLNILRMRMVEGPALHRKAERDTTGSLNRQLPIHTLIGPRWQGKRHAPATLRLISSRPGKGWLTVESYCGKRALGEAGDSLKNRANTRVLPKVAFLCAALAMIAGVETAPARPVVADALPIASDVRLAGDAQQTRFILDLDRKIDVRAFVLADPYRVVLDIPQVTFQLAPGVGQAGQGLIRAFRYGLVMPGGSRIVFDLTGPAKIEKSYVLDPANGQPARLVVELAAVDRAAFKVTPDGGDTPKLRKTVLADASPDATGATFDAAKAADSRPVIVIDPGHGGIDNGTVAGSGENEKSLVLEFALSLRDRIEKTGRYRVVMTRDDDTFVPLGERVKIARAQAAALFVSIHADYLPKKEGDAQGATIYTLSDKASDSEAERLAESENKADAIAGIDLREEPAAVADILIELTQRETRAFSSRFAKTLAGQMKLVARMHKHPLKSAGFRVLKAHDVPSVLVELGYVSNKEDLHQLVSEQWRTRTIGSMVHAMDMFFGKRVVSGGLAE